MSVSTRILFFTRTSEAEARKKRIVEDVQKNRLAVQALIWAGRRQITASGIPALELNQYDQVGNSFGEKLTNGIESLFNEGVQHVIVIGNDSPELTSKDLLHAQSVLDRGCQAMGKTSAGGTWILGLRKELFDRKSFAALPWQSSALGQAMEFLLNSQGDLYLFRELGEISTVHSLSIFLSSAYSSPLKKLLLQILRQDPVVLPASEVQDCRELIFRRSQRAPPL